ncbi:D-tyrosyl-tRNA(Tyr) deacylase [Enterococcus canis]|uniref:D-aminoacyl-tRNA deacylase n=1 Tax=Enterococcus canis TaxID=214095 RepID=A0A1L8RGL0_9ENTE|nr:D-aminoacyl-tRNA deacylase [Enterococcus canis]OJG18877.1 D-tyrosyl-tRNA(Tyr) deacylase [Enterococcus canis]
MRAVIQRVQEAQVTVADETIGAITKGFLIFLGVTHEDTQADADYLIRKISKLRVFEDEEGRMNLDLRAVSGSVLSVSQFTLYADTKKGNRPSFVKAAAPEQATALYDYFNEQLRKTGLTVATGQFGAEMQVQLVNDGPVTILIDTKE